MAWSVRYGPDRAGSACAPATPLLDGHVRLDCFWRPAATAAHAPHARCDRGHQHGLIQSCAYASPGIRGQAIGSATQAQSRRRATAGRASLRRFLLWKWCIAGNCTTTEGPLQCHGQRSHDLDDDNRTKIDHMALAVGCLLRIGRLEKAAIQTECTAQHCARLVACRDKRREKVD